MLGAKGAPHNPVKSDNCPSLNGPENGGHLELTPEPVPISTYDVPKSHYLCSPGVLTCMSGDASPLPRQSRTLLLK
jgi:hypothetical protein